MLPILINEFFTYKIAFIQNDEIFTQNHAANFKEMNVIGLVYGF